MRPAGASPSSGARGALRIRNELATAPKVGARGSGGGPGGRIQYALLGTEAVRRKQRGLQCTKGPSPRPKRLSALSRCEPARSDPRTAAPGAGTPAGGCIPRCLAPRPSGRAHPGCGRALGALHPPSAGTRRSARQCSPSGLRRRSRAALDGVDCSARRGHHPSARARKQRWSGSAPERMGSPLPKRGQLAASGTCQHTCRIKSPNTNLPMSSEALPCLSTLKSPAHLH